VTNFAIDHAKVEVAQVGECGTVFGEGVNPDAEGSGGWAFRTSGHATGGFADGVGVGGSRAARIEVPCGASAGITHGIDVVANHPALELFVATSGHPRATSASASLGGISIDLPPIGETAALHVCLPPSLAGQTTSLTLSVSTFPEGSFSCVGVPATSIVVDSAHVVSDPACPG
jgi:hypothetical protein